MYQIKLGFHRNAALSIVAVSALLGPATAESRASIQTIRSGSSCRFRLAARPTS